MWCSVTSGNYYDCNTKNKKKKLHIFGIPNKMCAARVIYHEQFLIENMNRAFYVNENVLRSIWMKRALIELGK